MVDFEKYHGSSMIHLQRNAPCNLFSTRARNLCTPSRSTEPERKFRAGKFCNDRRLVQFYSEDERGDSISVKIYIIISRLPSSMTTYIAEHVAEPLSMAKFTSNSITRASKQKGKCNSGRDKAGFQQPRKIITFAATRLTRSFPNKSRVTCPQQR